MAAQLHQETSYQHAVCLIGTRLTNCESPKVFIMRNRKLRAGTERFRRGQRWRLGRVPRTCGAPARQPGASPSRQPADPPSAPVPSRRRQTPHPTAHRHPSPPGVPPTTSTGKTASGDSGSRVCGRVHGGGWGGVGWGVPPPRLKRAPTPLSGEGVLQCEHTGHIHISHVHRTGRGMIGSSPSRCPPAQCSSHTKCQRSKAPKGTLRTPWRLHSAESSCRSLARPAPPSEPRPATIRRRRTRRTPRHATASQPVQCVRLE
jgi:hypothetical protein